MAAAARDGLRARSSPISGSGSQRESALLSGAMAEPADKQQHFVGTY
jgi:hypothetical protein